MRIGDLAARTGVSPRALRYYEEHGLLESIRTAGQQRSYDDGAVERVRLLRLLFAAGLSSSTIASLLPCVDTPSTSVTAESVDIMGRERRRIEDQIAQLTAAREQLDYLIDTAARFHDDQSSPRARQVAGRPAVGADGA